MTFIVDDTVYIYEDDYLDSMDCEEYEYLYGMEIEVEFD